MLFFHFWTDQNVIQIDYAIYIKIWFKYAINIKLKSNKNVDKINKHDLIFKYIISSAENDFSIIAFANSNAMIYIAYINFNESARFNGSL